MVIWIFITDNTILCKWFSRVFLTIMIFWKSLIAPKKWIELILTVKSHTELSNFFNLFTFYLLHFSLNFHVGDKHLCCWLGGGVDYVYLDQGKPLHWRVIDNVNELERLLIYKLMFTIE